MPRRNRNASTGFHGWFTTKQKGRKSNRSGAMKASRRGAKSTKKGK